ncbi:hypothetical protein TRICHSKD4_2603 [Roseibium sp. TrichSKD4]|nr:hypothetical protein TRICHSKD4_2603 [Roseibium sp. TrichSKD4]
MIKSNSCAPTAAISAEGTIFRYDASPRSFKTNNGFIC